MGSKLRGAVKSASAKSTGRRKNCAVGFKEARANEQSRTRITPPDKPLKPAQCRAFMRRHLAESFPKIVEGFVNQAETGSCMHVKLASELLESKRKTNAGSRRDSAGEVLREWRARMGKG